MKQPFISYREENENGLLCYYICQKEHPHYVGIISVGQLVESLASAPVANYNLYVNFIGVLRGNYVPNYSDVLQDIQRNVWEMANWFYINRIVTEPKKYSKFKLHDTTSNQ